LDFSVKNDRLQIAAPGSWFDSRPLTFADLGDEARVLDNVGFELKLTRRD